MTSVVGLGAVARFAWWSDVAWTAVAPSAYLSVVLIVQAASSAVIGLPSDHFEPERSLNVQDLPSFEWLHDFAQSLVMKYPSLFEDRVCARSGWNMHTGLQPS